MNRILSSIFAEQCESQYSKFLNEVVAINKLQFLMFNKFNDRLHDFLAPMLNNKDYAALYYVFQIICVLFHGQAAVETGFSVNKDYLVENLQEESLIALRFVYDHMNENNVTSPNISITNELLNCYRGACTAYAQAPEEKQKQKGVDEKVLKRKRIEEKLQETSLKKQKLSQSI